MKIEASCFFTIRVPTYQTSRLHIGRL